MYSRVNPRHDLPICLALLVEHREAELRAQGTHDLSTADFLPEDWWIRRNKFISEHSLLDAKEK